MAATPPSVVPVRASPTVYQIDTVTTRKIDFVFFLAPLTAMCSAKAKFVWHDKEQKAFEDIKTTVCRETLLAYPDFLNDFHMYTDSSDFQLGAVIMQDDRPLAFYSRKLNSAQKRYTTGKQELLSIVKTLKEFKNILLGHKNLLYQKMSTNQIIRCIREPISEIYK
jgi:hypothetical protein